MGAMSETDGFRMAMELSKKETKKGRYADDKPTKGGSGMEALMSDTAGFQKILELSKREEEER